MSYLDHLAELLHCCCLSDLRLYSLTSVGTKLLLEEPELYSLEDYTEAAQYLLADGSRTFQTSAQAKDAIIEYLLSRK